MSKILNIFQRSIFFHTWVFVKKCVFLHEIWQLRSDYFFQLMNEYLLWWINWKYNTPLAYLYFKLYWFRLYNYFVSICILLCMFLYMMLYMYVYCICVLVNWHGRFKGFLKQFTFSHFSDMWFLLNKPKNCRIF